MKLDKTKWSKVKIEEVTTELKAGFSSGKFELDSGEIAHLRTMNISDDCKLVWDSTKYITREVFEKNGSLQLRKGDVLFNNTNSTELVGKSCYVNEDIECGFSNHITRVRTNDDVINSYFLYVIFGAYFQNRIFESYCQKWVGQSGINRSILGNIQIPLPPLEEQKQIAALFQSIETAMEQVDGQEKHLKALLKNVVNGLFSTVPVFGNLLHSKNCTSTTIGSVAECDKKYPEHEKEVERFVGLENIEPENFQLQGFGLVANGTTFAKRFAKGDVLFGKRRAYLKKVAIADFDGICSGDILVIRAKAKKMLQGLLPYYISADAFINHAVSTSAGSLSPRTKWKDLETFEVSIPDLKTQEKIVEVLQRFDTTIQQLKQQKATLKQKLLNEILG
jgi:type I restriction enzyme, S subunit